MSADLEGSLRTFTLSDVLQMLGFSGQTGTLTLSQGWNSRTICFEQGRLTYIAAATRLPTIGELLIRSGRLDAQRLRAAMTSAEYASRGLASTLLDWGWVTPDDLKRCRDQVLEETIFSLFLWRNCRFSFEISVPQKSGGLAVDMTTERLIIDGTRRVDEWIAISPYVPSMRMTFRRANLPSAGASGELSDQDLRVLEQVDGRRDGVAIALACGQTQFDTAKSLAELSRAGLARTVPPDKPGIIELFNYLVESIYVKLVMYGHARVAAGFQDELNRFSYENKLKVTMRAGKVVLSDLDTMIDSTTLIDFYKLFIAIQQNRFSRMFEPEVVQGLLEGLYLHLNPELKELMRMYEFYQIEGLLVLSAT
jgi:hypothetical protein